MTKIYQKFAVAAASAAALALGTIRYAEAATIVSTGTGSAVSVVDRSATFDTITNTGIDLTAYSEDQLNITVPDISFVGLVLSPGFSSSQFYYGNVGNNDFVTISTTDRANISGLEFLLGTGNAGDIADVVWETYLDKVLVGSGRLQVPRGTVVGWSDRTGFDEFRVGASSIPGVPYTAFGQNQAIVLDNLKVQLATSKPASVPEPATVLGLGIFGLNLLLKKKLSSSSQT